MLIKCVSQNLGFSGGKPVAACVIYKCLLHWRSFEVERTTVFDRIIQTIASAIEVSLFLWSLNPLLFSYIFLTPYSAAFGVSTSAGITIYITNISNIYLIEGPG